MSVKRRARTLRTALGREALEPRSLMAGDCSAWQNPLDPNDLDNDGVVAPADALVAINSLNSGVVGDLAAQLAPPTLQGRVAAAAEAFLDASGDGNLSPADALSVINAINAHAKGGLVRDLPEGDQQADVVTDTTTDDGTPAIGQIDLARGYSRTIAALNAAGDVDVFQVLPSKENLHITLFSANRTPLHVELRSVDPTAEGGIRILASGSTDAGSRKPARLDAAVESGATYFVVVQRGEAPPSKSGPAPATSSAAADLAVYALGVLNYSDDQFHPLPDSNLGDDQHGDTPATATPLVLQNTVHALVKSNIDAPADVDSFLVEAKDGKLVVAADAEFPLSLTIVGLTAENQPTGPTTAGSGHVVLNAAAGRYMVSVRATSGEDVGGYRLSIVNVPLPPNVPHDRDGGLAALFARADADDSGAVTKGELLPILPLGKIPALDRIFNDWDSDDDGQLDFAEFEAGFDHLHEKAPLGEPLHDFINRNRRG